MATKTIGTVGRDYSTLTAWASYVNALSLSAPEIANCYNDSGAEIVESDTVTLSGWTGATSTNTVTLQAATGQKFSGNPLNYSGSNGVAFQTNAHAYGGGWAFNGDYLRVKGLQFKTDNYRANGMQVSFGTAIVDSCIFKSDANSSFNAMTAYAGGKAINCLFINIGASQGLVVHAGNSQVINCTIISTGGTTSPGAWCYNSTNLVQNCVAYGFTGTFGANSDPNSSSGNNATSSSFYAGNWGNSGVTGVASTDFVNAASDWRLSSGSILKNAGLNSGYAYDIIGTTRPQGASYDIGAFELAVATTTTLTAAYGSFSLTGQTSALKDNRLIPSAFGSFALNGKAANLLKSSKAVANFGSFAFNGQIVSLRNNKLIPLVFGSFTLTGIAAAFSYIKQLTINAGNYALNGQAAILSKAVKLVIANGSFALNGQASALSRTHSILSAFGNFTLNGQAVGLLETHRLPIGMGAYALNGQTVALYTSKLFSVAYGGYMLAGQAASFLVNRRLSLTVGNYALNGQVATLTKVGLSTLAASAGGYVLNGQVASLLANRKLSLVNGSYLLNGQTAQLTLIPALLATRGLYVLNGQNITFHQDRRLHANQGAYTLNGIAATLNIQAAYNRSVARTLLINPENRTFIVNPENRVHTI